MWRFLCLALIAGCMGADVEPAWYLEDPAGDADAGADILHVLIDEGEETRVEVLLAAELDVPDGQIRVFLPADGGWYFLSATSTEEFASFGRDPCNGCTPQDQYTNVGTGRLDGRMAEWTFTREHAFTGEVRAQTMGAGGDGMCLHDDVGQGMPAADWASCA